MYRGTAGYSGESALFLIMCTYCVAGFFACKWCTIFLIDVVSASGEVCVFCTGYHVFLLLRSECSPSAVLSELTLILLNVHQLLGNGLVNKFSRRQILGKQSVARSGNNRTNVYSSLLGNSQGANGLAR
jgi:hypothetical protein